MTDIRDDLVALIEQVRIPQGDLPTPDAQSIADAILTAYPLLTRIEYEYGLRSDGEARVRRLTKVNAEHVASFPATLRTGQLDGSVVRRAVGVGEWEITSPSIASESTR